MKNTQNEFENELASSIAHIIDEETHDAHLYVNNINDDFEFDDDDDDDIETRRIEEKSIKTKNSAVIIGCVVMVLVVLIVVAVCVMVSINNRTKNTYSYNYKQAKEYYNNGKYDDAIKAFKNALEAVDKNDTKKIVEINMYLYDCYSANNQPYGEIQALNDVLVMDKFNEEALTALAKAYYDTNNGAELNNLIETYKSTKCSEILVNYYVAKPVSNIPEGKYDNNISIELSADDDSSIYYTLDGSVPNVYSSLYSEAFEISSGTTELKIIAINSIGVKSEVVTYTYDIKYGKPAKPTLSVASGNYSASTDIAINNLSEGASAYYTWDGTAPSTSSEKYDPEKKIEMIPGNNVLSVIIVSEYGEESPVATYIYNLSISSKYTYSECLDALVKVLTETKVLKSSSELTSGEECRFVYNTDVKQEDKYITLIYFDVLKDGSYERNEYFYGVDSNTLDVYKVTKNDSGYELELLK